jgi:hypothetical protein
MIAVCGPGRTLRTALILAVLGEPADEIQETRHLPDPDSIILLPDTAFDLPPWPDFTTGLRPDPTLTEPPTPWPGIP